MKTRIRIEKGEEIYVDVRYLSKEARRIGRVLEKDEPGPDEKWSIHLGEGEGMVDIEFASYEALKGFVEKMREKVKREKKARIANMKKKNGRENDDDL
jgi:hypothetical protein